MESSSSSSEPDEGDNNQALLTLSQAAEQIYEIQSNHDSKGDNQALLNPRKASEESHEIPSNQDSKGKAVLEPSEAPEEVNEAHADQAPKEVHEAQADQNPEVEPWKREPEWLDRFIKNTYHEPCSKHNKRRNELNLYCIDCDIIFCQFCLSDPKCRDCSDHRIVKIYRHVYKNVIPIVEIVLHMDCSQIQPYRSNKLRVLAVSPLPHSGGKYFKDDELCLVCKRKLADPTKYSYCSILCKLEAFRNKKDANSPPFLLSDFPENYPVIKAMLKGELTEAAYAATPETENEVAEQDTAMTSDEMMENKNKDTEQQDVITVDGPIEKKNEDVERKTAMTGDQMMGKKNEDVEPAIKAPVAKPKVENKPKPEVKDDEDDDSDSEDDDDFNGDSDSEEGMDADVSDDSEDDDDDSEESGDEKPANEPEEAGKKRPGADAETPRAKKAKIATPEEQQAAMTGESDQPIENNEDAEKQVAMAGECGDPPIEKNEDAEHNAAMDVDQPTEKKNEYVEQEPAMTSDEQTGKTNEDGEQEAPMNPDQPTENENEDDEQGVPMNVDERMEEKNEAGECRDQPIEKINEDVEQQVAVTGEYGDQSLEKTEDVKQKATMIGDEPVEKTNEDEVDEPVKTENPKPVITYRKRDRKGVPIHALLS